MPEHSAETQEAIDIFKKMREEYGADENADKINILLVGEAGSGKTHLLKSAPGPILIDCFDPGGLRLQSFKEDIKSGRIIPRYWDKEDPDDPRMYEAWEEQIDRDMESGIFNHIGTHVIDSLTMWDRALMNYILKLKKIKSSGLIPATPQIQNYSQLKHAMSAELGVRTSQPCNFILTSHIELVKDDVTGEVLYQPMVSGQKVRAVINALFDEIWYLTTTNKSDGLHREIITTHVGRYKGRTRVGGEGVFNTYETDPDISELMRRAGISADDKPFN